MLPGTPYEVIIPSFARTMVADDVLLRLSAPSTGVLLLYRAWYGGTAVDGLNEPNMIQIVRLSTDGAGGGAPTFEQGMTDIAAFPGTAASLDAAWTTAPTVSDAYAPTPANLATGWEWAAHGVQDVKIVAPSERIGLRIIDASSAGITWEGGVAVTYLGS